MITSIGDVLLFCAFLCQKQAENWPLMVIFYNELIRFIDYFKTNCLSDQMYKSYRTYARKKIKLRALLEIYIFSKSLSSDLDISHVSHLKKT